jgi:hypothetical protein
MTMTLEDDNQCYETIQALRVALSAVVDAAVVNLTEEQEERVRDILNDTFRFWKTL